MNELWISKMLLIRFGFVLLCLAVTRMTMAQPADDSRIAPYSASVQVKPGAVLGRIDPRRLGGSNVAAWNAREIFETPQIHQWIGDMKPGYIRMPGGSWSDVFYWNGNGVRDASGKVDPTRIGPDGYPAVDYSRYAPSFNANSKTLGPTASGWHGHIDALGMHQFIQKTGSQAFVCVNVGTGRPVDAAEWVRFANITHDYNVRLWEMGNELDGSWEPGHFLKDDKGTLTGSIYAQRVRDFAAAMKAIDPTIRVGGAATGVDPKSFTRSMLQEAGDVVDFVSIHTYPGSPMLSDMENFRNVAAVVRKEVSRVRDWINEYQPARKDKIEIGYTEWNLGPGGDPFASDMFSGLWASTMLAEFARNGVNFATQWDCFTHVRSMVSGHGLILGDKEPFARKAQYFALAMWNQFTGNRVIESSSDNESVLAFATETDDSVVVQLLNIDRDRPAEVRLDLGANHSAKPIKLVSLSSRQYFWNRLKREPSWSNDPEISWITDGRPITLPPFSIVYAIVSGVSAPPTPQTTPPAGAEAALEVLLPNEVYVGDKVEGWLQAKIKGTDEPFTVALEPAELSVEGTARFDRPRVRMSESCGRFFVTADAPGPIVIRARSGKTRVEFPVLVKDSIPRPVVFWNFVDNEPTDEKLYSSDWPIVSDPSTRANKFVARIDLPKEGVVPAPQNKPRTLLQVHKFPDRDKLDRANIRGAVFDLKTSNDFRCDDPDASVQVVMQSPADYWMVLGSAPLKQSEKWNTFEVTTSNDKYVRAMPTSYNLWLVLKSSKPVSGSIYLDRIGLMVR